MEFVAKLKKGLEDFTVTQLVEDIKKGPNRNFDNKIITEIYPASAYVLQKVAAQLRIEFVDYHVVREGDDVKYIWLELGRPV